MARSVRLDEAVLLEWSGWVYARLARKEPLVRCETRLFEAIERALAPTKARPKRKPRASGDVLAATAKLHRWAKKAEKRERRAAETADLWKQAMARSGGFCECKCGRAFHEEGENKPEMDHEASRRVPQTITNVWMLTLACHRERQRNRPSEVHWLRIFLWHCKRLGYEKEAKRVEDRIAVVEVKGALPASPRVRP